MPKQGIIVTGDKELDRAIAQFEINVQKKAIRKATRESTKIIKDDAKQLAPIDTGALTAAIKVRAIRRTRQNKIGHRVTVNENLFKGDEFYGGFQELGTKFMEADPYLRPALYSNQETVRKAFRINLTAEIKALGK